MTEATWGEESMSPLIDWRMSASLVNVPRGDGDLAEVTSLARAVAEWRALDPEHQADAVLKLEHPLTINGALVDEFTGGGISALVERMPSGDRHVPT